MGLVRDGGLTFSCHSVVEKAAERKFQNVNSNSTYYYLYALGKYMNLLVDVFICKIGLIPDLLLTCTVARIELENMRALQKYQMLIRGYT